MKMPSPGKRRECALAKRGTTIRISSVRREFKTIKGGGKGKNHLHNGMKSTLFTLNEGKRKRGLCPHCSKVCGRGDSINQVGKWKKYKLA